MTTSERFWSKVTAQGDCLVWTAGRRGHGYGGFSDGRKRKNLYTHRYSFEECYGTIPEGHEIHHVCKNRLCVNPEHLELLSRSDHYITDNIVENVRKRHSYLRSRTHCLHGHPYSTDNFYKNRKGARICRTCNRLKGLKAYYRRKQRM